MFRTRRLALVVLAVLFRELQPGPALAEDPPAPRTTAEAMRSLRHDHPRLYVLDDEIAIVKQQVKTDVRMQALV